MKSLCCLCLFMGYMLGFMTHDIYTWARPLGHCVTIPAQKGINGGGDAGDGIFCQTGFVIMPGHPGRGVK